MRCGVKSELRNKPKLKLQEPPLSSKLNMATSSILRRAFLYDRHPSTPSADSNPVKIIALIETAEAIMNLKEICQASPYISGLVFAAEDFARDLSITRTPSLTEFLYARSAIVTAARAFNLPSTIDLVETAQRVFAPGKEEVEYSVRILIADSKATASGRGAFTLDGKMIDAPVVGKARMVVKRAELCGFDVKAVEEEWKDQEPE
ncbi:putative Citrate lyase subunit beta [Glarea lozoyensis 74030]|uniref:Putative Citrate lyase subunit beta n=1 Tax=Glarea lozoyensis (strain ATCC 74030 / MF5533) TaxID=1104152 RepID=H0EZF8_GLAL7|nr:putative Citrate lyase subunit beta [Glarea lozoyensis 74030]